MWYVFVPCDEALPLKTIHLLRHAKASRALPELADVERPLSARGVRDAKALAKELRGASLRPTLILCSPALRTRATYDAIKQVLPAHSAARHEPDLYLASARRLLERLRKVPDAVDEVLIIGHNPGLEELSFLLIRYATPALRAKLSNKLPTCAWVTLEVDVESFRALAPNTATLRAFWPHTTLPHKQDTDGKQSVSFTDLANAALRRARNQFRTRLIHAAAGDVEGIHQLRVAVRKLRVTLRLFEDVLDVRAARTVSREARALFRALGEVRELDVAEADFLAPLAEQHPKDPGLERVRKALLHARAQRFAHARTLLTESSLDAFRRNLEALRAREARDEEKPALPLARKALHKRLSTLRKLAESAETARAPQLHALRKELKKLRYRAEVLAPLFDSRRVKAYDVSVARVQSALGSMNDVATTRRALRAVSTRHRSGPVTAAQRMIRKELTAREQDAREKALRRLQKLCAQKPFWR